MSTNSIETSADGFGVWQAKVVFPERMPERMLSVDNLRRVARRAIKRELMLRGECSADYRVRVEVWTTNLDAQNFLHSITFREVTANVVASQRKM